MSKKLLIAILLLLVVIGFAAFFAASVKIEEKIPEAVYKPTYELKLMTYMMSVSEIQKDAGFCLYGEKFNIAAEKFQTAIEKGNLSEIKKATKNLSSVAYAIPVRNQKIPQRISESEADLLKKIGELEELNQTTHPAIYHYDILNDKIHHRSYCGDDIDDSSDGGGMSGDSGSGDSGGPCGKDGKEWCIY